MAEDLISSLYPPPPPYYKYFTEQNVSTFKQRPEGSQASDLQPELRLQIPPEVPSSDQYRGYGSVWSLENKLPSLKDSGWKQLYSDEDETITSKAKITELHKLLDSLLLNFLELVASVSVEPAKFYVKIEHLKLILINMNHLLNTYRPHQTRESLIMLLQSQIESKKAEIMDIEQVSEEVKQRISDLVSKEVVPAKASEEPKEDPEEGEKKINTERQRKLELLRSLIDGTEI